MESSNEVYKTCDLCKCKTNCSFDILLFGDWQSSRDITVHYFCLLLSTHLPQRGQDNSGINGFLVRDIRYEINAAKKRICCFCAKPHATIRCFKCKDYFHIVCGRRNRCLFQFCNEFRSYCDECIPIEELQPKGVKLNPSIFERCTICKEQMGNYNPVLFIYGMCCNSGYGHNTCVQKYALASGYYLRCIWCRNPNFRETVRLQGIFVPDRDAQWERQRDAYRDLHKGHRRCDMDVCFCPRGRDYITGKWAIILCMLCGNVGAHNPKCIPGKENDKVPLKSFKCSICASTEAAIANQPQKQLAPVNNESDIIDRSVFMSKKPINCTPDMQKGAITFSDEDSTNQSDGSAVTIVPRTVPEANTSASNMAVQKSKQSEIVTTVEATAATPFDSNMPTAGFDALYENIETQIPTAGKGALDEIIETQLPSVNLNDSSLEKNATLETAKHIPQTILCGATTQVEPSPEIPHSGEAVANVITQSPVISSTSQSLESENLVTFDLYEFDLEENKCIGTVTICIDMNDERFTGRTLEEIQVATDLLNEEDVIARSDNTGIFAAIDDIIAKYK